MRRFTKVVATPPLPDQACWGPRSLRFFNKARPTASGSSATSATSTGSASASPSLLSRIPVVGMLFGGGARTSRGQNRVVSIASTFINPVRMGFKEAVGTSKEHRGAYHSLLLRLRQGGHTQLHFALTNMGGLATYQLILEGGITLLVFTGMLTGNFTPSSIRWLFEDILCLPTSWVGVKGAEYDEDKPIYLWRKMDMYGIEKDEVTGVKSVVSDVDKVVPLVVIPKEILTQLYIGHNVAVLLMPIQFPFLFATYPVVSSIWRTKLFPRINSIPMVRQMFPRLGADEAVVTPIVNAASQAPKPRPYGSANKIHASR